MIALFAAAQLERWLLSRAATAINECENGLEQFEVRVLLLCFAPPE